MSALVLFVLWTVGIYCCGYGTGWRGRTKFMNNRPGLAYRTLSRVVARWQIWRYRRRGTQYTSIEEIRQVLLGDSEAPQ